MPILLSDQIVDRWNWGTRVDLWQDHRPSESWCARLLAYVKTTDEPFILMQDDFWLNEEVRIDLVEHCHDQMVLLGAGCVRLYPCPGGDLHYGDKYVALVPANAPYRISCQSAIWNPRYVEFLLERTKAADAWEFEQLCTPISRENPAPVLAYKREMKPWPMEYFCSAVTRGKWTLGVKEFCEKVGVTDVDWGVRPFASA